MDKRIINVLKAISSFLLVVAVLLAFFISGIRLLGYQVFGVLSGSMEPTYPTGSLIYVKPAEQNELRVNDIITFSLSPNVIATHRIVELVQDENNPAVVRYRTKGDANAVVDTDLVSYGNIIGKASFCVPMLGYFASYIQEPPGLYVALVVCLLMIGFVFMTDTLEIKSRKKKKSKRRTADAPRRSAPRADYADEPAQLQQRSQMHTGGNAAYDYQSHARAQQGAAGRQYGQQSQGQYTQQGYAPRQYGQQSQGQYTQQGYAPRQYGQQSQGQYGQQGYAPRQYSQQSQGQYTQQGYAPRQYGQQSQGQYTQQGNAGRQYSQYSRQNEQQSAAPAQAAEQQYRRRSAQGYERQQGQDGYNGRS